MDNGKENYRRYLNGDDNGLVEIVKQYKEGLILYIYGIVNDYYTAEELTEDTFVKLGIKRPHFSGESTFKTWLYRIARNLSIDYLRKNTRSNTVSINDIKDFHDVQSLESAYISEERKSIIYAGLKKLKPEYRQVIWLRYFENFSIKDTAKIMKKSVHAIETASYRAKKQLKEELIKKGYNYENL